MYYKAPTGFPIGVVMRLSKKISIAFNILGIDNSHIFLGVKHMKSDSLSCFYF